MKTIGLIGGTSFESTIPYYKIINEEVNKKLGGLSSAKILLYSVNFHEFGGYLSNNDWPKIEENLSSIAKNLENAGADYILICSNTMHMAAPFIESQINIPLVHIADATIEKLKEKNIKNVILLGTKYTMQQDFYKERIINSNINVLIPKEKDMEIINNVIFDELCVGKINPTSKKEYLRIIEDLQKQGGEGVIFGCTEIGLLLNQEDISIPVFDTTVIHSKKAASLCADK